MPTWLKLALTALAAFGLGFAAARRFPPPNPPAAADLTWERVGGSVKLTTKTPDEAYLIVETAPGTAAPPPQDVRLPSSITSWSIQTGRTITVPSSILAYQCSPVLDCVEARCKPTICRKGDCWPPPRAPFGSVVWWENPSK